jgi:hypothetical protein
VSRHLRRRVEAILVLTSALLLLTAPVASAANATGKNMTLPAGRTISGTITKQAGGTALANASVYAQPITGGLSGEYDTTDATGKYTITSLEPGTYRLWVTSPYTDPDLLDGYYRSTATGHFTLASSSATAVSVTSGNATGKNVALPAGQTITGVMKTSGGAILQYGSVSVSGPTYGYASTDATGTFVVHGLPPGSYKLSVSPPYGKNYQRGWYRSGVASHFTAASGSASSITVASSPVNVGTIKLPAGYKITGKLTTSGGTPLADASAYASGTNGSGYAYTAADGTFTIIGLANGSYYVSVDPPYDMNLLSGYYRTGVTSHFTTSFASHTDITISGANASTGTIKLPAGYKIIVNVKTTGGTALANVDVWAEGPGYGYGTTDGTGKATIQALGAGSYTVQVDRPSTGNYQSGWYRNVGPNYFTAASGSASSVTVSSTATSKTITVRLPVGAKISGKITKSGGTAVADACVYAMPTTSLMSNGDCTGADGLYEIVGLPAGGYRLQVDAPSGVNLQDGFFDDPSTGNFTIVAANADVITVSP